MLNYSSLYCVYVHIHTRTHNVINPRRGNLLALPLSEGKHTFIRVVQFPGAPVSILFGCLRQWVLNYPVELVRQTGYVVQCDECPKK